MDDDADKGRTEGSELAPSGTGSAGMATASAGTAFFSKTYDETLAMLEEAQAYLRHAHPIAHDLDNPLDILVVRTEAFRLSSRLMQAAAWLLAQRAVHNGEIDPLDIQRDPKYRLGARKVCRDDSMHDHPAIPRGLGDLLKRSLNLYIRIERLDSMQSATIH
jgi:regulator of CtrA degradation